MNREQIEELPLCELDGLVAALEGKQVQTTSMGACWIYGNGVVPFEPHENVSISYPIIEREKIALVWLDNEWRAFARKGDAYKSSAYIQGMYLDVDQDTPFDGRGPTMLIAAMRAYVLSKQE